MKITTASLLLKYLVEYLEGEGVEYVFGVCLTPH